MSLEIEARKRLDRIKARLERIFDIDICLLNNEGDIVISYSNEESACCKLKEVPVRNPMCKGLFQFMLQGCKSATYTYKIYHCHNDIYHILFPVWFESLLIGAVMIVDWKRNIFKDKIDPLYSNVTKDVIRVDHFYLRYDKEKFDKIIDFFSDFVQNDFPEILDYYRYRKWYVDDAVDDISVEDKKELDILFRVGKLIEINCNKNYKLEELSSKLNITIRRLSDVIRKRVGLSFNEFNDSIKIDQAKRLLIQSNESISTICNILGYDDVSNFMRKFKKMEDITMVEYREKFMRY